MPTPIEAPIIKVLKRPKVYRAICPKCKTILMQQDIGMIPMQSSTLPLYHCGKEYYYDLMKMSNMGCFL